MSAAVRKFRVAPATIRTVTLKLALRQLAWQLPVLVGAGAVGLIGSGGNHSPDLISTLLIAAAIVCLTLGGTLALGLARARKAWRSLELTVSPSVLRLQMADLAPIEVLRFEVTRIVELEGVGLVLHTADPTKSPLVSRHLEGFAELRAHLATWRPLESSIDHRRKRAQAWAWSAAMLGAWLAAGLMPNMIIAGAAGVALIVMGSISLTNVLKMKTLSNRYKASALATLGLFMLAPVARLVLHFFGP